MLKFSEHDWSSATSVASAIMGSNMVEVYIDPHGDGEGAMIVTFEGDALDGLENAIKAARAKSE
jgi:hypothetical protein